MQRLAILVLLSLLALPSLYLYRKNLALQTLLLSTLAIVYLWAIIKNSRYLIILYPFVLIVPFILFYNYYYDSGLDDQILSIVIETNWQEALGFLGTKIYLYIGVFTIWLLGITLLFWYNHYYPLCWAHRSRWWLVISVSIAAISGITANQILANNIEHNFSDVSENFLVEEKNTLLQEFKQTYPLGILISFYDLYQEQRKINAAFAKHQQFTFDASSSAALTDKQVVVLVIGETSRRKNWQLNNYDRATNPLLNTQKNVINPSSG